MCRQEPRSIDAVLFDFGGVVTRANPFTALAEAGAGDDLTAEAVLDILIGPYDSDTNHPFHRMERGEITGVEWYDEVSKVLSGFDITLDASKLAGAFSSLGVHNVVIERIQSLKDDGYQTGLITNNVKEAATGWQGMVDLTMFDVVIDSCMVGMRKPNPAIYKLALDELGGVAPARAVFLDDAAGNVAGAEAVGMHAILVGPDPLPALAELDEILAS